MLHLFFLVSYPFIVCEQLCVETCCQFSFQFLAVTRKTRIIDVLYNASNNELVRTKTLVKNCIISVDCTPFRTWYEAHYALPLGKKKGAKLVRVSGICFVDST
jgi:ribosomal protein S8E